MQGFFTCSLRKEGRKHYPNELLELDDDADDGGNENESTEGLLRAGQPKLSAKKERIELKDK